MKIAVDATCWQNQRGYGRHARALLRSLLRIDNDNYYTFFVDSLTDSETTPPEAAIQYVPAAVPAAMAAASTGRRSLRDMGRMSLALSEAGFDVVLFPTVYSFVPLVSRAKIIVFIHDVIVETYPRLTLPKLTSRLFWQIKVGLARRQADAIVTVSDYSRRLIARHFHIDPARVHVAGEASDPIFRPLQRPAVTPCLSSSGIPENGRLISYVGGFGPHKNLEVMVSAFARLASRPESGDIRLVLVGEYKNEVFHSGIMKLQMQINQLGIGDRVIFTGYLPDEEVVVLLNRSTVLALPSLMEGFGLPAVEAAACGCPVVATLASPLPELLGDAAIYIRPDRLEDLELALTRVLSSEGLRQKMSQAGVAAARALTWERSAHQLLEVIQQMNKR